MIQLGDLLIREEEVVSVSWRGGRLRLVLRWELEEVPVLLGLPGEVRLSWHREDDPEAGIPVVLDDWRFQNAEVRIGLTPAL